MIGSSSTLTDRPYRRSLVCAEGLPQRQIVLVGRGLGCLTVEILGIGVVRTRPLLVNVLGTRLLARRDLHDGCLRVRFAVCKYRLPAFLA